MVTSYEIPGLELQDDFDCSVAKGFSKEEYRNIN